MAEFNDFEKNFEAFDDAGEAGDGIISMFDENGNETTYHMLASKKDKDQLYLLVETAEVPEGSEESEVLMFKCISESDPDEMILELMDEDHESFEIAFTLFKKDLDTLGIEY